MNTAAAIGREVGRAAVRLRPLVVETPLVASPWLSRIGGGEVRLKLENLQLTGSFKLRGATNALLAMSAAELARGVVAASSGNHGLGLAAAAQRLGAAATIYVPNTTPASKQDAIEAAGAEVRVHGDDCVETEREARANAAASGRRYVSPYNDAAVVAGQGTIMVELLRQWPEVERVYVALGGGGLISGMAAHAALERPDIEFVACSPEASPAMAECVRAGAIVDVPCHDTLSDSTAGGVEAGAITFALCRNLVHRFVEVDEREIAAALIGALEHQHLLVEGAAAVAFAACLRAGERAGERDGKNAAIVVCGGNLPLATLRRVLGTG